MRRFKRMWAVTLSVAMIATSSSFGATGVYAAEGDILLSGSEDTNLSEESVLTEAVGEQKTDETVLVEQGEDDLLVTDDISTQPGASENDSLKTEEADDVKPEEDKVVQEAGDPTSQVSEDKTAVDDEVTGSKTDTAMTYDEAPIVQGIRVDDFIYAVDTQFAIVMRWSPQKPQALNDVTVPSTIKLDKTTYESPLIDDSYEREVIGIEAGAFSEENDQAYRLRSVKLEDSVKIIGAGAFKNCASLTKVEFPKDMTRTATDVYGEGSIGDGAFRGCVALAGVELPAKLNAVGGGIFADCTSLTSIEIPAGWGDTKVQKAGKDIVNPAEATVVQGPFSSCAALTSITFASGTSKVADYMLADCDSIENLVFPDSITSVGVKTCYGCDKLATITFGTNSGLTELGKWTFQKCVSLTAARLPKYTKTIGQYAFVDCTALTETVIPFSIGEVGDYAYFRCENLESLTFGDGDQSNITGGKIGKYAFGDSTYNAQKGEYSHPLKKITDVNIPNSITTIGEGAFEGCSGIVSLTCEDKFASFTDEQTIQKKAFYNCWALTDVKYSSTLTLIGESAFESCTSLASLNIPNNVTEIGKAAYRNCTALNDLKLSERLATLNEEAFKNCVKLRQVYIPMSITKVGPAISGGKVDEKDGEKGVFSGSGIQEVTFKRYNKNDDPYEIPDKIMLNATLLQKINMPEGETAIIGEFAFTFCELLKTVTIPESCVTIEGGAFGGCSILGQRMSDGSINTVKIPKNVTKIGRSAFKYCTSLEAIELPASLESIGWGKGDGAFESCTSLVTISIPDTVNEIGEATFAACERLESAKLPAGTTKIDNKLFYGCKALKEVKNVSKDYLEEIGVSAFEGCVALAGFDGSGTIDFSEYEKLKSIGDKAFYKCESIKAVTLSAATATLGESVLDSCNNLASLEIGTGSTVIPKLAFANDPLLKEVIVPRSVKTIKTEAFKNDKGLEKIHISKDTELEADVFSYNGQLVIYGFDPSPAKDYATKNGIPFVHDDVYATSIKFTDKTGIMLSLTQSKNVEIPGVDVKPVNYTVDLKYTSGNEDIFKVDDYTDPKTKEVRKVLNPVGVGTANLTVLIQADASGKMISDTVSVTVKKAVTGITMASGMKKDNTINMGESLQLAVVVNPVDATDKTYYWESGDTRICEVDSEGVVRPTGVGETFVNAVSNDDNTKKCTFNITVTNSKVKKADPDWPNNIAKPRIVGASSSTITSTYGSEIEIVSDTPGAQIYYTVNNTEPIADYEGHMDGATRHYSAPIVLDIATFGEAAIASGELHVNAKSIHEGFQYSAPVNFVIKLTKGSEWGDIDQTMREALFEGNVDKVPKTIWFAFIEGDKYYRYNKGTATEVSREYTGKGVTLNEGIRVYYGTSMLLEGRDYTLSYSHNTEPAEATASVAPTVTIKGRGGYYKGSENFTFSIVAKTTPEVTISGLKTSVVYTGKPIDIKELGNVKLTSGSTVLVQGTDYRVDPNTLRESGRFKVGFILQDKYTGTVFSSPVSVEPYNLSKDKDGDKKIKVVIDGRTANANIPYCKSGAKPEVVVTYNGTPMKEGLDYTIKYKKNKRLSNNSYKASVVIRGKGNFKGKYTETFNVVKQDLANVSLFAPDKVVRSAGKDALKVLPVLIDGDKQLSKLFDYDKFTMADCTYYYASGGKDGEEVGSNDPVPESGTRIKVVVAVKVKASGPYKVTQTTMAAYYRIVSKDLKKARITNKKDLIYNEGKGVQVSKDDFKVVLDGEEVPGTDYEIVSVKNNRILGSAKVEIAGKGTFGGVKSFRLRIRPRSMTGTQ